MKANTIATQSSNTPTIHAHALHLQGHTAQEKQATSVKAYKRDVLVYKRGQLVRYGYF